MYVYVVVDRREYGPTKVPRPCYHNKIPRYNIYPKKIQEESPGKIHSSFKMSPSDRQDPLSVPPVTLFLGSTLGGIPLHIDDPRGPLHLTVNRASIAKFAFFILTYPAFPASFFLICK